ncbi:MAG: hypothetical protein K5793_02760 [Nitrosarchaeum sp.]|nr:hypothetical protein [Nitrosarchaeum sp.]
MTLKKIKTKDMISEPVITDFGNRKVSQQNFSKIVALPKTALDNCGITSQVNVKLVQWLDEKYIQLTPIEEQGGEHTE